MIKGVHHVGLSVVDLERSLAFYRDGLGLEVESRGPFAGERYEAILGLPGATGTVVVLKGHGVEVELFEFDRPTPKAANPDRPVCDHGITHFCIEVEDIEREYERLLAAGALPHCPPLDFSTAKATYVRDPDGNVLELLEISQGAGRAGNARASTEDSWASGAT